MQVSRGGYYAWKNNGSSRHQKENESLIPVVLKAHRISRGSYGARRMAEEITQYGVQCGRYRARTLMEMAGVSAKQKKKFKATTDSKHNLPVTPNLLNRNFEIRASDEVWVGDITYIWTPEGWLYLAVAIDLFPRRIVGWAMSGRIKKTWLLKLSLGPLGAERCLMAPYFTQIGVASTAAISSKRNSIGTESFPA
jgi:putative transposase